MKRLLLKIKNSLWWVVFLFTLAVGMFWFLYSLIRPSENKTKFLEDKQSEVLTTIKENQIRAKLEKDKIGAIKKIYDRKLEETKNIQDREERLKALIRLHEELDL